jgi:hypothetical protein
VLFVYESRLVVEATSPNLFIIFLVKWSLLCTMSSRKKVLLKVIILGDSGYVLSIS